MQLDKPLGHLKDGDPSLDRVVGITSFGVGEEYRKKIEKPGVYTNVGFFREWIDCIVKEKMPKVSAPCSYFVVKKNHIQALAVLEYISVQRKCDSISFKFNESVVRSPSSVSPPIVKSSPSPEPCSRLNRSEKASIEKDALKVNTLLWKNITRTSPLENEGGY